VRAADRFAVGDAVWSTRVSRSVWPDALTGATAFGKSHQGSVASWRVTFEPTGRAGALLMGNDLFLLDAGRSIRRVKDPALAGLTEAAGAVKLGDQWYLGFEGTQFTIVRVDGDRVSVLGTYPLSGEPHRRTGTSARVVRSASADGLGIWVVSGKVRGAESHWYVYPVDADSGAIEQPLELGPTELATLPPPCGEGDQGWLLQGAPPVAPYVDLDDADLSVYRLEARLIASPVGLCTEGLAADVQSEPPGKRLVPRSGGGLSAADSSRSHAQPRGSPLALAARADPSLRRGYRCTSSQ
jgi:hypothetical protein